MKFYLNGIEEVFNGDLDTPLLNYLRDDKKIKSVKDGCSPQAACGACTVQIENRARLSCVTPMGKVEGLHVITPDGLSDYRKRVFTNAFVEKSGVQCGFCIPGIVMQANVLIEKNPNPTREEIAKALQPNLCRCTGYKKIIDSIEYAAKAVRDNSEIPKPVSEGNVGARHPKYNAENLVLGQSPYVDDIDLPGMLYGALKFSKYPRAKVLSIDIEKAEALDGVVKVLTYDDIPGDKYSGLIVNDWPMMLKVGDITRYVGDVIVSVIAETEKIAREAIELIEVDYEVLEPITEMEKSILPNTPNIHPNGNLLSTTVINRGNVSDAKQKSKYVSEGIYETQMIEHAYMEPECAIAKPEDNNGVEVLSQGQGVYEDRKQIAKILALPEDKVRVILVPNGGGFGGKEDLSLQHHAALASYILKRPVKFRFTRDESIMVSPKRHPIKMKYSVGCDENGMLTYLDADIIGDTGAYASVGMKVLERAAGHSTGAYNIPNVSLVAKAVYTNNIPCGAMRGFGANQATFAIEGCVDDLCEQGNFDKWQFRFNNALKNGDVTATGQIIKGGAGVKETLLSVKDEFQKAKFAGIACGIKNTGIGNGMPDEGIVKIEIVAKDKIILHHGWTEMGQGVNTMAVQFLVEETNIPPEIVEVIVDTKAEAKSGMTTASRATSIIGNSIRETCKEFKDDLKINSLDELVGKSYIGQWVCDWTTNPDKKVDEIITHYSYSYATQVVILDDGGKISKVIAAHDAGKIINPNLFEGQIEGAVHMGLGYAISENMEMNNGIPSHTNLRKLGVLRAKETPDIEVIGVEVSDPVGPHGAKGVGEIGLVPTAGAVANAFYSFDKTRYYKLPIKNRSI